MKRPAARAGTPLRVVTYNVLVGGARRQTLIRSVLRRLDADVIALQEVVDPQLARDLGAALRMRVLLGAPSDPRSSHLAILTRRPVRRWRNRRHGGVMLRGHLQCTIATGGAAVPELTVHCVHLAARFGERAKGEARRLRELAAILGDVDSEPQAPHLLLGDFNSLSPGDEIAATRFFRMMSRLRRRGLIGVRADGLVGPLPRTRDHSAAMDHAWRDAGIDPRLEASIPVLPRIVGPLTMGIPVNARLDRVLGRFIERWAVPQLRERGYVDCFRAVHPRARGFTCATWLPAARIDYVFATPDVSAHLVDCDVVGGGRQRDADAAVASDHFPLRADFGL